MKPKKTGTTTRAAGTHALRLMKPLPQKPSLIAQAAGILREQIQAGTWVRWLPPERKLAEALRVSRVTLRQALARLERERWVKGGQGRRREILTQKRNGARTNSSRNVVLLTPLPLPVLPPFMLFCTDALREHLGMAGYHLEVQAHPAGYSRSPARALEELQQSTRAAGWLLYLSTAPLQKWFSDRGLPGVIIGSRHEGVGLSAVDVDQRALCRHAAGLLLARKHKRVALLSPDSGCAGDFESELGFREGATSRAPDDAELLIVRHDGTREGVSRKLGELLRRPKPPTGFLVSGSKHALTTLTWLAHHGTRLPQDAALISRDHDSFLERVVPTLAHYSVDPTLFAHKISRVVLQLVQGSAGRPKCHRVTPRFVPGQTLG